MLSFPARLRILSALQRDAERSLISGPHSGSDLGCCLSNCSLPRGHTLRQGPRVTGLCWHGCHLAHGTVRSVV